MVKGWGKSSQPFSRDTFAKYPPVLVVAINVPDHSVENKIFSQPHSALDTAPAGPPERRYASYEQSRRRSFPPSVHLYFW